MSDADIIAYLVGWAFHIREGKSVVMDSYQADRLDEAAQTIQSLRELASAQEMQLEQMRSRDRRKSAIDVPSPIGDRRR